MKYRSTMCTPHQWLSNMGKNPLFPCFTLTNNNTKQRFDLKDV